MFDYEKNKLLWNGLSVETLTHDVTHLLKSAHSYSGPFWLYQESILHDRVRLLEAELPGFHFYYSVKSQSNLTILSKMAEYARVGADVVSGGELFRALKAGFSAERIVFAGVGKSEEEIQAALQAKIRSFHVESISELRDIARLAALQNLVAPVSLRLNPDVEVDTHKHITTGKEENKFGLSDADFSEATKILKSTPSLALVGLQAHIGSQIFAHEPYVETARYLQKKADILRAALGKPVEYLSLGGGFGIDYKRTEGNAVDFPFAALLKEIRSVVDKNMELHFEPGRFISAPLCVLMSRVRHLKTRTGKIIAIIDAAMNDLIRPMLYEAYHPILPVEKRMGSAVYDIVGPVCESTDTFASQRTLTELAEDDWVAIGYAGAYGSAMSSNFNARVLLPEVLLTKEGKLSVIRKPQTFEQMIENEI